MDTRIYNLEQLNKLNFESIVEDDFWNQSESNELTMHKIHVYPAKFPALIVERAFEYARLNNYNIDRVGDIFCGCGTVALESKIKGIDFWGTDINPVASLISHAKTIDISATEFQRRLKHIINHYSTLQASIEKYNKRLLYWHDVETYHELHNLLEAIRFINKNGKYREVFSMIFSSILKQCSRWLNRSIKPQVDPEKIPKSPMKIFVQQSERYLKAYKQIKTIQMKKSIIDVQNKNILKIRKSRKLDMIITSPPYVTSYEYADLHQLSSLWLGYTDDFKELRKDTIGSIYNLKSTKYKTKLSGIAREVVEKLSNTGKIQNMVARYYYDMSETIKKCKLLLNINGLAVFVIGDTEYKGVKILNAESLSEMLIYNGFEIVEISKRKISNKFLPSNRDEFGKFASIGGTSKKIYSQEYIIIAENKGGANYV